MNKIVYLGTGITYGGRVFKIYVHVEITKGALSITGVEGPLHSGNCLGSCGQIVDHLRSDLAQLSSDWTPEMLNKFIDVWQHWHLNDMRPGCEHQRAEKWDERRIDETKPTNTYGKFFDGQQMTSWNMWAWITPEEHPNGLLAKPCPVCGYKYGTAWLEEKLPQEVIDFLASLPESPTKPAWI